METAGIHEWLDGLSPSGCTRAELCDAVQALQAVIAHAQQRSLAFTVAIDELGDGGVDAATARRSLTHESARVAKQTAKTAAAVDQMPAVADALAAGEITLEHAQVCADAAERVSAEHGDGLVESAKRQPADRFRRDAREATSRKQKQRDVDAEHARQHALRDVRESVDDDGLVLWTLAMPEASAKILRPILDQRVDKLWRADGGRDGTPNEIRTPAQRRFDAAYELLTEQKADDDQPVHPRFMVHLLFTIDPNTPADVLATWADGAPVPDSVLTQLGPAASVVGHVFSGKGQPLWLGRTTRLANTAQWISLIATQRGCIECAAPISRTQAHHDPPWQQTHQTNIDTLELRCGPCHALAHHTSRGDPRHSTTRKRAPDDPPHDEPPDHDPDDPRRFGLAS